MKIAILLSGQPRFSGDFTQLLKNLKGYDHADWFCCMPNNNSENKKQSLYVPNSWKQFAAKWAISELQSNFPANNYIQAFEISKCDIPRVNVFKGRYNLYRANQLRLDYQLRSGITYNMVLRVRPDVSLIDTLDLRHIDQRVLINTVILPRNHWAKHPQDPTLRMCDQFAIASSNNMTTYANLHNDIEECINILKGLSIENHPEISLLMQLQRNKILVKRGPFSIGLRRFSPDVEKE